MKREVMVFLVAIGIAMSGCGGGGKAENPDPVVSSVFKDDFKTVLCTELNHEDDACNDIEDKDGFDLSKDNVLVLSAPEAIGTSPYFYYEGRRFGLVPKDEKDFSPKNMLAYGLMLFARDAEEQTELIRRLLDYGEAKKFLEELGITGTEDQNKAILDAINYNLERLGEQGMPTKQAYLADIKAMAEELVNLTAKQIAPDFTDMKPLIHGPKFRDGISPFITASFIWDNSHTGNQEELFLLSKEDAARIGAESRAKSDKPNEVDNVFEKLSCQDNEDKQIYMYGVYDSFVTTNPEPTTLSTALSAMLAGNQYLAGYDEPAIYPNIKIFADTLGNLPTNLTNGIYAIGLKENGIKFKEGDPTFVDRYFIGDLAGAEIHEGNVSTLRNTWDSAATDVYSRNLSAITTTNGQSLLSMLQGGQSFLDTVTMMTTNVDFIAIGVCVPKEKPETTPVPEIPTKLECNEEKGEELLTIWGGTSDDFAQPVDGTTPSAAVVTVQGNYPNKYDDIIKEKVGRFGDTLNNPNSYISQLEILINTRPSTTVSGAGNDRIFMGDAANQIGAMYDPNAAGIATPNGGTAHLMYGTDTVYDSNQNPSGTLRSLMNTNNTDLDVLVLDQTEVDTIRLSMCVVKDWEEPDPDTDGDGIPDDEDCAPNDPTVWEGCDEGNDTIPPPDSTCNQKVSLDLRPATSWVDAGGNHPTENNVFSTYPPHPSWANVIWDGAMNWFDYGSAGNTVHPLSVDYCACGDTSITIDELKSDNFSKIYLDTDPTPSSFTNPAYIASRSNGISQDTMASWGSSESGYLSVPFSGTAPIDHTLHFDVKNGFGPSGGAVNGTLAFVGHLGACTDSDTVGTPTEDNNTIPVPTDTNWTVVDGGVVQVVTDITWVPNPDAPVGTEGNGTIVIGIAGPIIATNPAGKPFVDKDPKVVIDAGDLEFVEMSAGAMVAATHLVNPPEYTRDPVTQIVTDHQQNLQWQDDENVSIVRKQWVTSANYSAGNYMDTSGDTASTYCADLTLGGYTDWRLPTKSELLGIVDYSTTNPSIDTSVFANTASTSYYWSATTHASYTNHAWIVYFSNGGTYSYTKSNSYYVRCVR